VAVGWLLCQGSKIRKKKKKTEVKKWVIITRKSATCADRNFTPTL